jgi:hypothetical protein
VRFPKLLAAACAVVALLLAFFVTEPQSGRAALAPDSDGIAAVDGLDEALLPADPLVVLVPPSPRPTVDIDHPRPLTRLAPVDVFRPPQARA